MNNKELIIGDFHLFFNEVSSKYTVGRLIEINPTLGLIGKDGYYPYKCSGGCVWKECIPLPKSIVEDIKKFAFFVMQ